MWTVLFEDKTFVSEKEIGCWDSIPTDKKIKEILIKIEPYNLLFSNFTKICVAKVAFGDFSGNANDVGYSITVVKDNMWTNTTIKNILIIVTQGKIEDSAIPERCFRLGLQNS